MTLRVIPLFVLAAVTPLFFSVIVGFAGLLDLGYVAFFAIGAYAAAYFASGYWANAGSDAHGISILAGGSVAGSPGIHLNFLLVLAVAVAATAVAGAVIGVPTLRLRGDYIAIVTLAFGEIVGRVVSNGREIDLFGGTLSTGQNSIGPIDPIELPLVGPFDTLNLRPWYWFALVLVALALFVNVRLRDARTGRAWVAMRDDERTAACAGIPIVRTKLLAYGTGAAFGGMAGAVILSVVNSYLLPDVLYDLPSKLGQDFNLSAITSGIYGAILLVVMLLRPYGVMPTRRAVQWSY